MRLSRNCYVQLYGPPRTSRSNVRDSHFSSDLLWDIVKRRKSLDAHQKRHAMHCRDCREFVEVFSFDARHAGFSFPDLLLDGQQAIAAAGR